ncbi:MAG: 30S ribosomal protein S8e [Nanoarchaeota archaeon]
MVIIQDKARRKPTGGRYKDVRTKRLYRMGRAPMHTKLDKRRLVVIRTKGGGIKQKLHSQDTVNVYDPKSKKYASKKILKIVENPANRHFSRRNIITKGSIIETESGKARITSRPGQEGTLNAVLIEEKK